MKNQNDDIFETLSIEDTRPKQCIRCNTRNKYNSKYCKKCGTDLKDIICPICETVNRFDQHYCKHCNSILQNMSRR